MRKTYLNRPFAERARLNKTHSSPGCIYAYHQAPVYPLNVVPHCTITSSGLKKVFSWHHNGWVIIYAQIELAARWAELLLLLPTEPAAATSVSTLTGRHEGINIGHWGHSTLRVARSIISKHASPSTDTPYYLDTAANSTDMRSGVLSTTQIRKNSENPNPLSPFYGLAGLSSSFSSSCSGTKPFGHRISTGPSSFLPSNQQRESTKTQNTNSY